MGIAERAGIGRQRKPGAVAGLWISFCVDYEEPINLPFLYGCFCGNRKD